MKKRRKGNEDDDQEKVEGERGKRRKEGRTDGDSRLEFGRFQGAFLNEFTQLSGRVGPSIHPL